MHRFFVSIAAGVLVIGCRAKPQVAVRETYNNGIDIVPPAIVAASKSAPTTLPDRKLDLPNLLGVVVGSRTQNHDQIMRLIRQSQLETALNTTGDWTLFAPTDEAFDKLPPGTLDKLLLPENHQQLLKLVNYHLVHGRLSGDDLLETDGGIATIGGSKLTVRGLDNAIQVNDSNVIESVTTASNGNVYWVDTVLDPDSAPPANPR